MSQNRPLQSTSISDLQPSGKENCNFPSPSESSTSFPLALLQSAFFFSVRFIRAVIFSLTADVFMGQTKAGVNPPVSPGPRLRSPPPPHPPLPPFVHISVTAERPGAESEVPTAPGQILAGPFITRRPCLQWLIQLIIISFNCSRMRPLAVTSWI